MFFLLQWRYNERHVVSNHWRLDYLLSRLFRRRSKKTSKLCATGLCEENPLLQRASNAEIFSIWWHHHVIIIFPILGGGGQGVWTPYPRSSPPLPQPKFPSLPPPPFSPFFFEYPPPPPPHRPKLRFFATAPHPFIVKSPPRPPCPPPQYSQRTPQSSSATASQLCGVLVYALTTSYHFVPRYRES